MTVITRQACGFDNGTAVLSYSFDDSTTPPPVTEIRLANNSTSGFTLNIELLNRTTGAHVVTFSQPEAPGQDQVLNRTQIVAMFGDVRMVDTVDKSGGHGWDLPYFYRCWSL